MPVAKDQSNMTVVTVVLGGWDVRFVGSFASPFLTVPIVITHPSRATVPTLCCPLHGTNVLYEASGQVVVSEILSLTSVVVVH